ncbi:hypothetical protein [Granulicella tundricola]|nr:hypothetical protein [Granulicella tundricola]
MPKSVKTTAKTGLLTKADRAFIADFSKSSQSHVDKVTRTKALAMKELVDAGIYDVHGKLRKRYRSVA